MDLTTQLLRDEGVRGTLYHDSRGIPTIGVGHNLTVPLSDAAIRQILADDIAAVTEEVEARLPWTQTLSEARKGAVLNLAFNLGVGGLTGFRKMLAAMLAGDWTTAARELLDSAYAHQVGDRAVRLARQIQTDEWV